MTADAACHRPPLVGRRLLGQGAGAALIRPDGEIDWWCPDRFDASPAMWSLLDPRGGTSRWCGATAATWSSCPAAPTTSTVVRVDGERLHLRDGLVATGSGSALIRLVRPEARAMTLMHELCLGGFDRPSSDPRDDSGTSDGSYRVVGADATTVDGERSLISVQGVPKAWSGFAIVTAGAGDEIDPSALEPLLDEAERADRQAMSRIRLPRDHPNRATDALRVMRALTDVATGAPVAAPTTSVPEAPGGERQFDYRYSWLRDSALSIASASLLGHLGAASRYLDFLTALIDRYDGHIEPLTTSSGERVPEERDVPGVAGWAGSAPVRVGNAAAGQRQLDAAASVIDAVWRYATNGGRFDEQAWSIVECFADALASAPYGPTSGIWEFRQPTLLVSEELARWHGLDRALLLRRRYRPWRRRPSWKLARDDARRRVESAFDPITGRLPLTFQPGDTTPDAAVLAAVTTGFWTKRDPRARCLVHATIDALEEGAFLRRYPPLDDDGFAGVEGSFVPSSWWAVTALAMIGEVAEARRRADDLCAALPPLQPEEWDAARGEPLGNVPLLWSHMETAGALYCLHRAQLRRRVGPVGLGLWSIARYGRLRLSRNGSR